MVLLVFREEYYLKNKEPRPGTEEHLKWESDLAAALGKGRDHHRQAASRADGHCGAVVQGEFTRFADLADDSRELAR